MDLIEHVKGLIAYVKSMRDPRATQAMVASVVIVGVSEAIVIALDLTLDRWWALGHLLILPLTLFSVALGHKVAPKRELGPLQALIDEPHSVDAPFLLAQGVSLHRKAVDAAAALEELTKALAALPREVDYQGDVIVAVAGRAVWAVCGRKNPDFARCLYEACATSHDGGQGQHVERVFLPPRTLEDEKAIHLALKYHFKTGMTALVFPDATKADSVCHSFHLPRGFGMTLMGECPAGEPSSRAPVSKSTLLVHWGGIEHPDSHHGVLLRDPAWLDHFWRLFERIRAHSVVANPTSRARSGYPLSDAAAETSLRLFLADPQFKHYSLPKGT